MKELLGYQEEGQEEGYDRSEKEKSMDFQNQKRG